MYRGFCDIIEEGEWLPTFKPRAGPDDWVSWIERSHEIRESLLIAHIDGNYAGHLSLQPEEWMASRHVAKLGIIVANDSRDVGVGRSLLMCAEEAALNEGYSKITLSTFASNDSARHLYEATGYRLVGTRREHFKMPKGYIDEVLYEKLLQ
jgi:RimJ/RimL family protein N-acetyltransferase